MQIAFTDMTAMPLTGNVYMAALSTANASYDAAWNSAFGSSQCPMEGVTVCAYNTMSNTMVRTRALLPDMSVQASPCSAIVLSTQYSSNPS